MHELLRQTAERFTAIRHEIHANPELAFEEASTSKLVAGELTSYGYNVSENIGRTGVVGTLSRGTSRKSIALRADMDALPIVEKTGLPYSSRVHGKMHACGHDGHICMLLGAAHHLAENCEFDGTLHLIFQPAEEDIGGAREMINDGLFERFDCDAVYAMHNFPGLKQGTIYYRAGVIMAAVDTCYARINGVGGHGGMPHLTVDPVVIASNIVMSLQTIVSRNVDPTGSGAVVTVGKLHAGERSNVIPDCAEMEISVRSFCPEGRRYLQDRICNLIKNHADAYGATVELDYELGYAPTINSTAETEFVTEVALNHFGASNVCELAQPYAASEDFSAMLEEKPGCYFGIGMGDEADRAHLHDPRYDFNDACLPVGASMWVSLTTRYLS